VTIINYQSIPYATLDLIKNQNDGVMVFIRKSLTIIFTLELQTQSHTVLEIQVKKWNTSFLIYAMYRSPNNDVELFLNE